MNTINSIVGIAILCLLLSSVGCLPNAYDSTSFISSNFSMKTDYFTTERPTNRLPCSKDERKKMKCVNKGTCFVVVIKDHRLRACHCPEGFVDRNCATRRIPSFDNVLDNLSNVTSASLFWGILLVQATLIILFVTGFVIRRKFFRNQTKDAQITIIVKYDLEKQQGKVKESVEFNDLKPVRYSDTEPLEHSLQEKDDMCKVTIGASPNQNRSSSDGSAISTDFHSNEKLTNL